MKNSIIQFTSKSLNMTVFILSLIMLILSMIVSWYLLAAVFEAACTLIDKGVEKEVQEEVEEECNPEIYDPENDETF